MATFSSMPGEFHGQRSLAGYSPLGCKESDMTEQQCACMCAHTYFSTHVLPPASSSNKERVSYKRQLP